MHANIHPRTRKNHTHTYTNVCTRAHTHTHTNLHTHANPYTFPHTHTHKHTSTFAHTHVHKHAHIHRHIHPHAYKHINTHPYKSPNPNTLFPSKKTEQQLIVLDVLAECCGASEEAKDAVLAGHAFGVLSRVGLASTDTNVQVQRTATHCNTLQHTATHCNTLQYTAIHYHTLQHTVLYRCVFTHTVRAKCTVYGNREGVVHQRIYKSCIHICSFVCAVTHVQIYIHIQTYYICASDA